MSVEVIKLTCVVIYVILAFIFDFSIETGVFTTHLKYAIVIQIVKPSMHEATLSNRYGQGTT